MKRLAASLGLAGASVFAWSRPQWLQSLDESWNRSLLGLQLWQWLGLLTLVVVSIIAGYLAQLVIRLLQKVFRRHYADQVTPLSRNWLRRSAALTAGAFVGWDLIFDFEFSQGILHNLYVLILALRFAGVTWLVVALWEVGCDIYSLRVAASGKRSDTIILPFVRNVGRLAIFSLGLVACLDMLGYNVSGLVTGLGIGGAALALASKDSVENVFGSARVVFDVPFGIGDWVKIGEVDGIVEATDLRSTRIRTFNDSIVTLPNSNLIKASIENMGLRRYRRLRTNLILLSSVPASTVKEFLKGIQAMIQARKTIWQSKSDAHLYDVSEHGLVIQLTVYFEVPDLDQELAERESLLLEILELAEKMDIRIMPPRQGP